ncbi:MAG: TraB/GumN family protein [Gammaproteobacteria bacterium]|nr:TraB/GumN family protein [Gammaproteobacteria bacterium]
MLRLLWAPVLLAAATTAAAGELAPFLWRVDGPHATHYLMGSVHLLPQAADTLPDALEQAYDQVDEVVFESDLGALSAPSTQLALLAAARSTRPLADEIGAAAYARLRAQAQRQSMPMSLCDGYRAWFCALSLQLFAFRRAGFSEEYGIDQHFYGEALTDGKSIAWLEPVPQHLALFTQMPEAMARELLDAALDDDAEQTLDSPQTLYRAWRDGDTARVAALDRELATHYPRLYQRLLAARNHAWLPQLRELLSGDQAELICVGAAHWVGPDGLIAALRRAGFDITPVAALPDGMRLQARVPALPTD